MSDGGKKLFLLGVISVAIAIVTTGVSVFLYHVSGDIYLDRSRPGFLPDEKEIEETGNTEYFFSDSGEEITREELKEYLEQLSEVQEKFNALPDPYSAESLSDGTLNISK